MRRSNRQVYLAMACNKFVVLTLFLTQATWLQARVVRSSCGLIKGETLDLDGVPYHRYLGIPYAEPPVGRLRFRAPVPKAPWDSLYNATAYGPSCPQDISAVSVFYPEYVVEIPPNAHNINEDCLTLNIFAPVISDEGGFQLAVMFWIHGGSFETGQGSGYDASALAVRGRVIVVTINYRLNIFGFFSSGDEKAPGNFGMLDQQLALQWVHENIVAFGGDPSRVTLFGQSAGGASVTLHLFANKSRPLFHRAAAHSGYSHPELALPGGASREIAEATGCDYGPDSELVECLRGLSMEKLLSAGQEVAKSSLNQVWVPVRDNNMWTFNPGRLEFEHDIMMLFTSGDGSVALEVVKKSLPDLYNFSVGLTEEQWDAYCDLYFSYLQNVGKLALSHEYIDPIQTNEGFAPLKALVDTMMDWNYLRGLRFFLDVLPNSRSIHVSIFDHRCSANQRFPRLNLVPHSEELPFLFGLPFNGSGMGSIFTDREKALSDRVITYWSNFAKSGDPNVNPDLNTTAQASNLTYWPEYGDSETYLLIQLNNSTVGQGYRKDKVMFWNDYLPKLASAAREYCFHRPGPGEPPTMSADKPECTPSETFFVESLGLKLTQQQAEKLIKVFIFLTIALLCVMVILCGAVMGYKFKYKGKRAALNGKDGFQPTNGDINKHVAYEVNEGFTTEFEDTKM